VVISVKVRSLDQKVRCLSIAEGKRRVGFDERILLDLRGYEKIGEKLRILS
jgi:hypothetical protein